MAVLTGALLPEVTRASCDRVCLVLRALVWMVNNGG